MDIAFTQMQTPTVEIGTMRPRKERQRKEKGVEDVCAPKPPRKKQAKKGNLSKYFVANLTQQTPMPESETGIDFGPLPPELTPASKFKNPALFSYKTLR